MHNYFKYYWDSQTFIGDENKNWKMAKELMIVNGGLAILNSTGRLFLDFILFS